MSHNGHWGYIEMMESRMESTIMGYIGYIGIIFGLQWENGK